MAVEVTGDSGDSWFVRRGPDRWKLVHDAGAPRAASVRMDAGTARRLLSRTISVDAALPAIAVDGDRMLARAATRAVAIMTTKL